MSRITGWIRCLVLAMLATGGASASQRQLPLGNGVWIKPATTPVVNHEAALIANLKARSLTHVFLWMTGFSNANYAAYAEFIQQAHTNGMTVHTLCAVKTTVTDDGGQLSSVLLSNLINEVVTYNGSHASDERFDGVQIDVEGVTGPTLLALVSGVSVPETLVFSAAIQPNEFAPSPSDIESYYNSLLQNTDLDMLVPMVYIMDGIYYGSGTNKYTYTVPGITTKTDEILARLPSQGRMMTGLSAYDLEFAVIKGSGTDSSVLGNGSSQMAFGSGDYAVPNLVATYPLVDVSYQTNGGISCYRFEHDTNHWFDVLEMTPIGLRRSISAADQAGAGDTRYVGTCTWLYHTTFDTTSGRQDGFAADDGIHPSPVVSFQVISILGSTVRLRVGLTNANPSERVLGAHSAAGVHLQLDGASFVSADEGTFHAAEAFNSAGTLLTNMNGAPVIELRRMFFEDPASQQAQSGDIVVSGIPPFAIRYRAWMMDKDSLCNDIGTSEPYIARSPDDVHYSVASKFLTYATFTNNIAGVVPAAYASAVLADRPVSYHRFSETNVVSLSAPFTVSNLGTAGLAGNGVAATTNYCFSTSILGSQPGALASATNTALKFPGGSDTNRIIVPYKPEWNVSGPFSVELWLKGGTNFCCPAASAEYDTRGWLIYQGDSGQTTGNGWYFRVYKSSSTHVTAQVNMTVNANAWYHIGGVYDGTSVVLYTNGAFAVSTAVSGTYTPNTNAAYPLNLGARSDGGARSYGGFMDEAAFYTNALTASQVAAHYKAATTNAVGYAAQILLQHPAGYWNFNEPLNPPEAANTGSYGSVCDGVYLNGSTTIPDLRAPTWPGLETTNMVLQIFGPNGQVVIPPLNLNTNTVTFECLLKRNGDQQNYAGLIMHRNLDGGGASACGLGFRGANSHLGYYWNDAANTYTWDSGLTPPDGQWTYVALAVDPTQAVICMCDGTTWNAATHSVSHAVQAFAGMTRVGTDGGTNRWFNGLIDEAAIYNVTLSQAQLRAHALAAFGNTNQPLFTQLPVSQTVGLGTPAAFNAATVGAPTILYRWQKDGVNLAGATNLGLSLPSADYTNAGQYRLGATNGYGGVLSPTATLVVLPPPSVTNLTYRTSGTVATPRLELIWPNGTLYSADELTGPWTVVGGAAPPYYSITINPGSSKKFFRVQ